MILTCFMRSLKSHLVHGAESYVVPESGRHWSSGRSTKAKLSRDRGKTHGTETLSQYFPLGSECLMGLLMISYFRMNALKHG